MVELPQVRFSFVIPVRARNAIPDRQSLPCEPGGKAFLKKFPVTYPSYADPGEDIARAIQAATFYPQTIYFDRNGKLVYDHAGAYVSDSALMKDIRRYALGSG